MRMLFSCFVGSEPPAAAGSESGDERQQQKKKAVRRMRSATARLRSLSLDDLSRTLASSGLHAFTQAELRAATRGLSSSNFIGEGGFGPVYKGFLDGRLRPGEIEPQHVAVKYLDADGPQGHREWLVRIRAHAGSGGSGRTYLQLHMHFYLTGSDTTHLLRTIDACCRPRWCTWGC